MNSKLDVQDKGACFQFGQQENLSFDGNCYDKEHDQKRLTGQLLKVYECMKNTINNNRWYTLAEIEYMTGAPAASASAQLRNLRKDRFGGHTINKRPRGDRSGGLFEYSMEVQ